MASCRRREQQSSTGRELEELPILDLKIPFPQFMAKVLLENRERIC